MGRRVLSIALLATAAACAVGPEYRRPDAPVPAGYKEAVPAPTVGGGEWRPAAPADGAHRSPWWEAFSDPDLDALEAQVEVSNQTIAQADAAFRGAYAAVRGARSGYYPTIGATALASRSSGPVARGSASASGAPPTTTSYDVVLDLSWEIDLFGRVRRSVEEGVANAEASAADLESVRLAMQAELAADYFTLHGLDAQQQLLDATVAGYETALRLTRNRHDQGIASGVDVAQAETQLETTRAEAIDLGVARAQTEHAIAILLGKPPAELTIAAAPIRVEPPAIPVGLPSDLLQRRPDIAASERRVAAASAGIGVARAAYYPSLTLAGSGGYQGSTISQLFSLPNRIWSLGPALAETVFDGGRRRSASEQAQASYDASVAAYRETVLVAFQQVEDGLAALRVLADEADQQARAVAAADHSLVLARNRYRAGIATYLEVITAQTAALANQRTEVDLLTRRMVAAVGLVKALGGGWVAPPGDAPPDASPPGATGQGGASR
jgi:NodT family efflux transporter outer membrane factor (OMF) lipoprotein